MKRAPPKTFNEPRVYRKIALPVSAFDVLQDLKRGWGMKTNAEVITRLLLGTGPAILNTLENAEDVEHRPHHRTR